MAEKLPPLYEVIVRDIVRLSKEIARNRWMGLPQWAALRTQLTNLAESELEALVARQILPHLPLLSEILTESVSVSPPLQREDVANQIRKLLKSIAKRCDESEQPNQDATPPHLSVS